MDRADVRVIQRSGVAPFPQDPGARRFSTVDSVEQLERHMTMEHRVIREEHGAHTAVPKQALDSVNTEHRARLGDHRRRVKADVDQTVDHLIDGPREKRIRRRVVGEQRRDFATKRVIANTC
jgi:hypothetical protein